MNLSKLAEITNGKIYNNKNINIKNIKIDSNQITEGDLLLLLSVIIKMATIISKVP